MTLSTRACNMFLNGLELTAFLGWPEEERLEQQPILVDIQIEFATAPEACLTDSLADTICYDSLIKLIKKSVAAKPFRLLEHLTHEIYQTIKSTVTYSAKVGVRVKKNPPIPELTGGAIFYIGD